MPETLLPPQYTQIRKELQEFILRDLLAPARGEDEIVDEPYVRDRYILGLLAPKGQSVISEEARCELLARLLRLNHERYEEDVQQGLFDKKKSKTSKVKKAKTVKAESG